MSVPIATRLSNLFTAADRCGDLAAQNRRLEMIIDDLKAENEKYRGELMIIDDLKAENEKYRGELLAQTRRILRLEREGYGR